MPRFRERVPSQRRVITVPAGVLRKDAEGCVETSDETTVFWLTRNGFVEVAAGSPSDVADIAADDAPAADAEADAVAVASPKPKRTSRRKQGDN